MKHTHVKPNPFCKGAKTIFKKNEEKLAKIVNLKRIKLVDGLENMQVQNFKILNSLLFINI